jgi:hypothetical protein
MCAVIVKELLLANKMLTVITACRQHRIRVEGLNKY